MIGTQVQVENSLQTVLGLRDFRLLFAGVSTSQLGDQFALIAMPWLVLQLTGDPLALGLVLALEGGPRAVFMIFGGAITDRFSPRMIMLICDIARMILAILMTVVVLSGTVQLWMLYAFSLGFGLVAGFAIPAGNSIVPMLVKEKDLQAGNSLVMGVGQLAGFLGPLGAGVLIGNFSNSLFGVGLAFGLDATTFAISALFLLLMRKGGSLGASKQDSLGETVLSEILTGLKHVWNEETLRLMFLIIAAVNFLFVGPVMVGIPVLADQRFAEGAMAFGLLMSGLAIGNLGGFIIAGALPRPKGTTIRTIVITLLVAFGVVLGLMGYISQTWVDFALLLLLGLGNGYVTIILFTSIQSRAPKAMMGRIMSLFMLSSIGLLPVSQALSGALIIWDISLLFTCAGGLIVLVAIWVAFQPGLIKISDSLTQ